MQRAGRRALRALVPLALALQSCEVGPLDPNAAEFRELRRNRAKWERAAVRDYRYVVRNTCFCAPEVAGPVAVEVRGGNPVSATYVESGAPARPQHFASRDEVVDLFDAINHALDRDPDRVTITYHRELGYPVSAHFDYDDRSADEESGFQVSAFQRL